MNRLGRKRGSLEPIWGNVWPAWVHTHMAMAQTADLPGKRQLIHWHICSNMLLSMQHRQHAWGQVGGFAVKVASVTLSFILYEKEMGIQYLLC